MPSPAVRIALNQRGVSFVEALVAVAMIGVSAVMVANYTNLFRTREEVAQRACQAHAQTIINAIQEETYYRQTVNFVPVGGQRTPNQFAPGGSNAPTIAIQNPALWFAGGAGPYTITPAAPVLTGGPLQNFQLINGTMRTLAAIYNNTAGVRCQLGAYAPLTTANADLPWSNELIRTQTEGPVTIRLRIDPYNRETGAVICPGPAPIYPAPTGIGDNNNGNDNAYNSAFSPVRAGNAVLWRVPDANLPSGHEAYKPAAVNPPDSGAGRSRSLPIGTRMATRGVGSPVNADVGSVAYGFQVYANIAYTVDGRATTCEVSQRFEYPVDRARPGLPFITVENDSYNWTSGARPNCSPNRTTARIIINQLQAPADNERGVQYFCRDLSWIKRFTLPTAPQYNEQPVCIDGGVQQSRAQFEDTPALQRFDLRQNGWVPCDQLQQCGQNPAGVAYNHGAGATNDQPNNATLRLSYTTLPNDSATTGSCVMNLELMAVDTAGNVSMTTALPNNGRVILEQPGRNARPFTEPITRTPPAGAGNGDTWVDTGNEMLRTRCGVFCAPQSDWNNVPGFSNGYWVCRTPDADDGTRGGCCYNPPTPPAGPPDNGNCTPYN